MHTRREEHGGFHDWTNEEHHSHYLLCSRDIRCNVRLCGRWRVIRGGAATALPAVLPTDQSLAESEPKVPESSEAWDKLATLVYWQGVEQRERDAFFRSLRHDINYHLQKLEFVPLDAGVKLAYTLDGVTYVPALPAIGRMVVRYKDQGNAMHLATSYLVGVKNGKYYIDLATPKRSR